VIVPSVTVLSWREQSGSARIDQTVVIGLSGTVLLSVPQ
jgi:hypothetical protein